MEGRSLCKNRGAREHKSCWGHHTVKPHDARAGRPSGGARTTGRSRSRSDTHPWRRAKYGFGIKTEEEDRHTD